MQEQEDCRMRLNAAQDYTKPLGASLYYVYARQQILHLSTGKECVLYIVHLAVHAAMQVLVSGLSHTACRVVLM